MRTGAIFARGSCRALKWMALFGVVFALGTGQALAQATFETGEWVPGTRTVTLILNAAVYGSPGAAAFVVTDDGASNAVTGVRMATSSTEPSREIRLDVTSAIATGSTVTVAYTAPTSETAAGHIKNTGGTNTASNPSIATAEQNSDPTLRTIDDIDLTVDMEILPILLPAATGGNGTITYTLVHDGSTESPPLPPGLLFDATSRVLSGTPTTADEYEMTYTATDAASPGEQDSAVAKFTITVEEEVDPADLVSGPVGVVTGTKLIGTSVSTKSIGSGTRTHVPEGANDVELEVSIELENQEIDALDKTHAEVEVMIRAGFHDTTMPDWVSPIDDEGDVDFPNANQPRGELSGTLRIKLPSSTGRPTAVKTAKGTLSILLPEDNHEAEPDGFYIEVISSTDINIDDSRPGDLMTRDVVIEDNDPQGVKVTQGRSTGTTSPTMIYEGVDTDFTITADPARIELPLTVELDMTDLSNVTVSSAEISIETASVTLNADGSGGAANNTADVTVHLPASDGNRMDDDYKLQASVNLYSLTSGGFDDIEVYEHHIQVLDVHKLPLIEVAPATDTVMEGEEIELTLTIDRNPANTIATDPETRQYTDEALTIMVSANAASTATMDDYTLPASVAVPENKPYKRTQTVKVTVMADEDEAIDAMEMLVVDFVAMGDKAANGPRPDDAPAYDAQSTLTIEEGTDTLVSVRDNAYDVIKEALGDPPMVGVGMTGELMGTNLFDYDANMVTVVYSTSVEGGAATASVSGATIMVMGAAAGEAKVTITATATLNSSSLAVTQDRANVAQLTFPVMVMADPITFDVMMEGDGNLAEGMMAKVTVMASRGVDADTEVMLMRDGASTASMDDVEVMPMTATIMMGDMTAEFEVTAVEDMTAEEMEMLTLFLVVDDMQMTSKSVMFYLWDAAVPALPVIAQLLLAAFLAVGGYRRYRRR